MVPSSWTDGRVKLLKALWKKGRSSSQIANELGGATRNAVIGKVHRLGLSGRARYKTAPRRATIPKSRLRKSPPPGDTGHPPARRGWQSLAAKPSPTILTIRDGMCRWLYDDGYFCGHQTCDRGHGSWCAEHADIVYQPRRTKPNSSRTFYAENSAVVV